MDSDKQKILYIVQHKQQQRLLQMVVIAAVL